MNKQKQTTVFSKNTCTYLLFILVGALLIAGKYEWTSAVSKYSLRSYLANLYLSLIFLPTLYFLFTHLFNAKTGRVLWGGAFLLFTLPIQWLGLKKFIYPLNLVNANTRTLPKAPDWFFNGYSFPTIPYEALFFSILFVVGVFLIKAHLKISKFPLKGAVLLWLLILIQTWMHLSLRSPYTYVPHYEQSEEAQYWYHYYLIDGNSGAVNLDYHTFRPGEELFFTSGSTINILASRIVPQYIASSLTVFFNSYYVFLGLNCLLWLSALKAFYYFSCTYFSKRISSLATILFSSAQGLILYVAQPKMYVFGITGSIFMLSSLVYCFKNKKSPHWIIYGSVLGLLLLCYEAQPWLPAIFLFAYFDHFNLKKVFLSLLLAYGIHDGFIWACKLLPELGTIVALTPVGGHPIDNIISQFKNHEWSSLLSGIERSVRSYLDALKHAFQWVLMPATVSLLLVNKEQRKLIVAILLPSVMTFSLFVFGKSFYVQFPRLVYSAYPAIYILAAVGLSNLWGSLEKKGHKQLGKNVTVVLLILNIIWLNMDTFGFPRIYYYWFYR